MPHGGLFLAVTAGRKRERKEMALSCLHTNRIFDAIEAQMTRASLASSLSIDGSRVGHGLPPRPLTMQETRTLALDTGADPALRDALWRELARLAQADGDVWLLPAIWMMIPGFRKISARLSSGAGAERNDIEAEIIAGFTETLRTVDPGREKLGVHLWWAAYRHGRHAREMFTRSRETPVEDIDLAANAQAKNGEPDGLLGEAVHEGVITASEADLITRTRMEGERLGSVAQRLGLRYHACAQRRARAEGRLAGYVLINGGASLPRPGKATELRRRRCRIAGGAPRPDGRRPAA